MNEKHMGVVERSLLSLSGERRKLRAAADELEAEGAESHLVQRLREADSGLESVYKKLFQGTYFHVPEEQLRSAELAESQRGADQMRAKKTKGLDVPEPTDEMRLFKAEESTDPLKP